MCFGIFFMNRKPTRKLKCPKCINKPLLAVSFFTHFRNTHKNSTNRFQTDSFGIFENSLKSVDSSSCNNQYRQQIIFKKSLTINEISDLKVAKNQLSFYYLYKSTF